MRDELAFETHIPQVRTQNVVFLKYEFFRIINQSTTCHLSMVAGIIDEMSLVDLFNQLLGTHPQEIISPAQVVKAMIINGLGFISAPLYLFEKLF